VVLACRSVALMVDYGPIANRRCHDLPCSHACCLPGAERANKQRARWFDRRPWYPAIRAAKSARCFRRLILERRMDG
jgi:hypothetical protein